MPLLRTYSGGPYCLNAPYTATDEINAAVYNDMAHSVKHALGRGKLIASASAVKGERYTYSVFGLGQAPEYFPMPYLGVSKPNYTLGSVPPRTCNIASDSISCALAGGLDLFSLECEVHLPQFNGIYGNDMFVKFYILNHSNSIGAPLLYIFRDYQAFLTKFGLLGGSGFSPDAYVIDLATQGGNTGVKFVHKSGFIPSLANNVTNIPPANVLPPPGELHRCIIYPSIGSATNQAIPANPFIGTMLANNWPSNIPWLGLKSFRLYQYKDCPV